MIRGVWVELGFKTDSLMRLIKCVIFAFFVGEVVSGKNLYAWHVGIYFQTYIGVF